MTNHAPYSDDTHLQHFGKKKKQFRIKPYKKQDKKQ